MVARGRGMSPTGTESGLQTLPADRAQLRTPLGEPKQMTDWQTTLKSEFDADEGSFLIQLRPGLEWNKQAFVRLVIAMRACCQESSGKASLERWLANGFWYISWFVEDWTTHEAFPRPFAADYYDRAYEILHDLAFWFFSGESPYEEGFFPSPPE